MVPNGTKRATVRVALVYRVHDPEDMGVADRGWPQLLVTARRFGYDGLNITAPRQAGAHGRAGRPLRRRGQPDRVMRGNLGGAAFERDTLGGGFAHNEVKPLVHAEVVGRPPHP